MNLGDGDGVKYRGEFDLSFKDQIRKFYSELVKLTIFEGFSSLKSWHISYESFSILIFVYL